MEKTHSLNLGRGGFDRKNLAALERAHMESTFGSEIWSIDSDGSGPDGEAPPQRYQQDGATPLTRLISDVMWCVGDGKEATAYCCRGEESAPFDLALAKVYRSEMYRAFSNAALYRAGEWVGDRRTKLAIDKKTDRGRTLRHHLWVRREWETLCDLHDAGADVPAPYACTEDAILMELVGDERGAAPVLAQCRLERGQARRLYERLLENVELFLSRGRVHADLSAYNVLLCEGKVCIIDFPQAVDAQRNPNARDLLVRDLRALAGYFSRYGIRDESAGRARSLWSRYQRAEL